MRRIRIAVGDISVTAELNDTHTANAIWESLPFKARVSTWGDEIYFGVPVHLEEEDAQEIVGMGDLGYWPPGHAFCIFFGRTPMSRGNEIRPASPVNVFGKVEGDTQELTKVANGANIVITRVDSA